MTLACQDPAPREVDFLPGLADVVAQPPTDVDLAIAVDAADCGRLGKLYRAEGWALLPTVVIDHHGSNPGFGRWNWVAPQAAATCQMLTALALREGLSLIHIWAALSVKGLRRPDTLVLELSLIHI